MSTLKLIQIGWKQDQECLGMGHVIRCLLGREPEEMKTGVVFTAPVRRRREVTL